MTDEPPTEEQIKKEVPCSFSCCRNEQHWLEQYEFFVPTPKTISNTQNHGSILMSMAIACTINGKTSYWLLNVLFDSGGTATTINERALPKGCVPNMLKVPIVSQTIQGIYTTKRKVELDSLILPEFEKNLQIDSQSALVFSGESRYDIIFGQDFLSKIGMIIDFDRNIILWMGKKVLMKSFAEQNCHAIHTLYATEDKKILLMKNFWKHI